MDKEYPQAAHQEHMPATGETDEHMTAGRYIATRISTLKPPMTKVKNPIGLLRLLNLQQWLFFTVAFIAWTWDGEQSPQVFYTQSLLTVLLF